MNVNYNEEYQVIVDRAALEDANNVVDCLEDAVLLLRDAIEGGEQKKAASLCWLVGYVLADHSDVLLRARRGRMAGPMGRQTA
nr:MAG TPA: hypothetical protein [Caudoviricetes sp.]